MTLPRFSAFISSWFSVRFLDDSVRARHRPKADALKLQIPFKNELQRAVYHYDTNWRIAGLAGAWPIVKIGINTRINQAFGHNI